MRTVIRLCVAAAVLLTAACATPPQVMNITYPLETGAGFNSMEPFELVGPGLPAIVDPAAV